jgi:hypothetical protein
MYVVDPQLIFISSYRRLGGIFSLDNQSSYSFVRSFPTRFRSVSTRLYLYFVGRPPSLRSIGFRLSENRQACFVSLAVVGTNV